MADLKAYTTGGTVHVVVNKQLISPPLLERRPHPQTHATDIARV